LVRTSKTSSSILAGARCPHGAILDLLLERCTDDPPQPASARANFFRFCNDQGWIPDNPAKKIKNVAPDQEETLPFTREQYEALIEATYYFDGRSREPNGNTVNSKRARAYIQLLRWSGLRAADGACLAKTNLRRDGSLVLRQAKVKGHSSASVYVLLPPDVAQELREVPPSYSTAPDYFFWSGLGKRRAQTSKWQKVAIRGAHKMCLSSAFETADMLDGVKEAA
jgi:site-specific recombinase XerC